MIGRSREGTLSAKHPRVIGTTLAAIDRAEQELGFRLSPSFRSWLLQNNGLSADDVYIFPVYDERDPRKTWDSLVRQYDGGQWGGEMLADAGQDFRRLLPFASFGTGDFYCFDYSHSQDDGEVPIVLWSHETGETEPRGSTFADFLTRLECGEIAD